jgi:hypothetical protein
MLFGFRNVAEDVSTQIPKVRNLQSYNFLGLPFQGTGRIALVTLSELTRNPKDAVSLFCILTFSAV